MPAVPSTPSSAAPGKRPSTKRREAEVIDAAITIFHERGYSDTSVEEIANALGILKGSLYYYIDSKEDLLFAIVRKVHEDVERLLAEALEHDGSTPLERLRRYIRSQTEYNAHNIAKISVYYDDMSRLSSARMVEIRDARREAERSIRALIVEAQQAGQISPSIDPRLAGHSIFATVNWVYRWYDPAGRIGPSDLADFTARYALYGLTSADDAGVTLAATCAASDDDQVNMAVRAAVERPAAESRPPDERVEQLAAGQHEVGGMPRHGHHRCVQVAADHRRHD